MARWAITLLLFLTHAGRSQNIQGMANIDAVLAILPTYEAFCDAADARIAAIRDPSLPNVATGIVNAQMRCATIRQFREMIANDPTFFNSLSFPASKFDVWKAGVNYFLGKAEANQDPFAGMTSGLRAFRSKMDGQLLFYVFRLPPDYAASNRYALEVYLHTSATLMWYAQWMEGAPSADPTKASGSQRAYLKPSARGNNTYSGVGEAALMDEVRHFATNYSIDANRIIIGGGCMGGTGGVRTTALHPDHFSAGYNMTGGMSDGARPVGCMMPGS